MKRLLALALLWAPACSPRYEDDTTLRDISAQPASYDGEPTRVMGRTLTQTDGSAVLSWAGSAITTRFRGSSVDVSLKLSDGQKQNFMQIVLDGNDGNQLTVTSNTTQYTITAEGDGPHDLTLVKLNEPMDGVIVFGGFTPATGGALEATQRPTGRRLLFIGDSITCGYGNLGTISTIMLTSTPDEAQKNLRDCNYFLHKKVYQVSSAYQAYGTKAARDLKAEWQLISWSGKGIYRNADGTTADTLPDIWQRAVATDGNTTFSPSDYVPQAVVINLGTNDFGSVAQSQAPGGGPPNVQVFKTRYLTLVKQVRAAFPSAWIFLASGPMLSDYYPTTFKALTTMNKTLADIIGSLGDRRVQFLQFPLNISNDTDPTGCEWHPDAAQDAAMAARLTAAVQKALEWK